MALTKEETIAVVAGSISGLIVFLSVLASIIYCCIRHRINQSSRKSDQKSFRHHHLTPDTSLSKNSGPPIKHGDPRVLADPRLDPRLDPRHDSRLPKVGSNSLWFGSPSMYSAAPSQVYQDMKRKGNNRPQQEYTGLQGPPGHVVYQGPNVSRIYHSQQVVPATYEPDYRLQRTGSYMDLYSYPYNNYDPYRDMNNSGAMLMNHPDHDEYYVDRYREREVRRTGKKIRRSQSDVTLHSTGRPKNRKQRKEAPFDRDQSSRSRDSEDKSSSDKYEHRPRRSQSSDRELDRGRTVVADIHKQKKAALPAPKQKPKRDEIQSKRMDFHDAEISESATDSAKLRALDRERERNRGSELTESKRNDDHTYNSEYIGDNRGFIDDTGIASDMNVRPYNYEGKPSRYESPIVAKMAAMTDTPKATYANRQSITDNSSKSNNPPPTDAFHAEVSEKLEKLQDGSGPHLDMTEGPVATSTGNHSRASRPTSAKAKRLSRRGSNITDQDGNVITAQAFEFLDGYSDGEGTDYVESGSNTPTLANDYDINL